MRRTALLLALISAPAFAQASPLANGLYFGATVGSAEGSLRDVNNPQADRKSLSDTRLGLQLGYNSAFSGSTGLFWGIEGDVRAGELGDRWEGRRTNQYNSYYTEDKINSTVALKAKVGYATDRMSIYGMAGAVWAQTSNMLGCNRALVTATNGCATAFETEKNGSTSGYVLGVGGEYLISGGLSVKMEYNHIELNTYTVRLADPNFPGAPVNDRKFSSQFGELSVGLNYRF